MPARASAPKALPVAALETAVPEKRIPLPAAAERYATDHVDGAWALGERASDLATSFSAAWAKARSMPIDGDYRLAELAQWLAACKANALPIDTKLITLGAQRLGIPFADPLAVHVTFRDGVTAERLVDRLVELIGPVPYNRSYTRYGVGVVRDGPAFKGVVVLSMADVTFVPVARTMGKGGELVLDGTVADRYERSRLSVTVPDGTVASFQTTGRRFEGRFTVPDAGIYRVELLGDGATGPVVVANFPVYVDAPEPEAPRAERNHENAMLTAPQIEERLVELVNAERSRLSLPALARSDQLAAGAAAHSRDMADHSFFAHVSPSTGTTDDRLHKTGLPLVSYGENIAQGATTHEIHETLLASPAHRELIIHPRFTHVGIGVVVRLGPVLGIVATEWFGELRPLDPPTGGAAILERLNMARLTRALGAVREQADLRTAAEHGLALRVRDPTTPAVAIIQSIKFDLLAQTNALERAGISSTAVIAFEARSVDEVVGAAILYSSKLNVMGIAIAPQALDGRPTAQLVVLVLGVGQVKPQGAKR